MAPSSSERSDLSTFCAAPNEQVVLSDVSQGGTSEAVQGPPSTSLIGNYAPFVAEGVS